MAAVTITIVITVGTATLFRNTELPESLASDHVIGQKTTLASRVKEVLNWDRHKGKKYDIEHQEKLAKYLTYKLSQIMSDPIVIRIGPDFETPEELKTIIDLSENLNEGLVHFVREEMTEKGKKVYTPSLFLVSNGKMSLTESANYTIQQEDSLGNTSLINVNLKGLQGELLTSIAGNFFISAKGVKKIVPGDWGETPLLAKL